MVIAAWVLFSHTLDKHQNSPRLMFWSPTYGSGKTTALDLTVGLVRKPFAAPMATDAVLYRMEQLGHPTLIIDEADNWMKDGRSIQMGILNIGFGPRSVAKIPRVNMDKDGIVEHFNVWGAVVMASRGKKPSGGMARRTILIRMEKAPPDWKAVGRKGELRELHDRAASWAEGVALPDIEVQGVAEKDTWRPLLAVAQSWGRGDEMLRIAQARAPIEVEENIRLLRDIRSVFGQKDRLCTGSIINALMILEDSPWDLKFEQLNGRSQTQRPAEMYLSAQLKGFEIEKEKEAKGTPRCRGWARSSFEPVWERYLGPVAPAAQPE
jgi:putative DNA primase/helicase